MKKGFEISADADGRAKLTFLDPSRLPRCHLVQAAVEARGGRPLHHSVSVRVLLLLVASAMIQGVYTGERTHDGTAQGHGKLVFPDGGVYTGQFQDNTPNGSGTFQDSRCRSQGLFVKGKQHGLGSYTRLATGAVYEGEFNEGEYQGRGVLQVSTGKYDGQFLAGVMHGHGTFVWAPRFQAVSSQALTTTTVRAAEDQTVHNSSGDNDDSHSACSKPSFPDSAPRHDQGRVQSSSGTFKRQQYEGEWVRGQRSGRGRFTLPGFGPRGGGHYDGEERRRRKPPSGPEATSS